MECDNQSCQLLPNHPSCLFVLRFSDNQEFYLWRGTNHRMFCCCSKVSCISSAFQCSSRCKKRTMASSYLLCMHLVHLEPKEMCILIKGGKCNELQHLLSIRKVIALDMMKALIFWTFSKMSCFCIFRPISWSNAIPYFPKMPGTIKPMSWM